MNSPLQVAWILKFLFLVYLCTSLFFWFKFKLLDFCKISCLNSFLYSALRTPHSALRTLHSALCTPHYALQTLHSALFTKHSALRAPHFALRSPQSAVRSRQSAVRSPQSAVRSPQSAVRSRQSAVRTLQSAVRSPQSAVRSPHSALLVLGTACFVYRVMKYLTKIDKRGSTRRVPDLKTSFEIYLEAIHFDMSWFSDLDFAMRIILTHVPVSLLYWFLLVPFWVLNV